MPTPDPDDDPIAAAPNAPHIHVPHDLRPPPLMATTDHPALHAEAAPEPAPPAIAHVDTVQAMLRTQAGAPEIAPEAVDVRPPPPENLPEPGSSPSPFVQALSELNASGRGTMSLREAVAELAQRGLEVPGELQQLLK